MAATTSTEAFSLQDKVILVTGASSGIGTATARLCARLGAKLVITGRDTARLEAVSSSLEGNGHLCVAGNLTDTQTRQRLLDATSAYHGLVSCAGTAALVPFRMAAEKHLQQMLGINYLAPITLTQQLLYKRRLSAGASLIYVSALAARAAPQAATGYAAAKAALEAAVRTLALEHGRQGIRANCIAPGYVDTPMLDGLRQAANMDNNIHLTPLGMIAPEDVAKAVIYLLSGASRWITRSTLTLDGGLSLMMRL
ncbi:SDR family NAD(P)-dependent oxidoreductase [Xanthomonas albilineans]|uniref:SDR family NAD(P)-dependent oxidoreductase n=1 Tax=Xanthomonas albilineans TaxID=29447 RepID=UPI0005F3333B|nr:SDR family oxidoreductase [Xanthomonas albilineans]